jgi:hypothetical protein
MERAPPTAIAAGNTSLEFSEELAERSAGRPTSGVGWSSIASRQGLHIVPLTLQAAADDVIE